jgi:hypothetical protein
MRNANTRMHLREEPRLSNLGNFSAERSYMTTRLSKFSLFKIVGERKLLSKTADMLNQIKVLI